MGQTRFYSLRKREVMVLRGAGKRSDVMKRTSDASRPSRVLQALNELLIRFELSL